MKRTNSILLGILLISFAARGQGDSLSRYLEAAARNSPGIQAAFHAYEASLQRAPQMGALEDPRLDIGFFLQPMELVDGRQIAQFQFMQMFPWFGTRKAARTEAQQMAKMAWEQFRETRDNLFFEVSAQWYALCRLQQQLVNGRQQREWLAQLENLAIHRFSSGISAPGGASTGSRETATAGNPSTASAGAMAGMGGGATATAPPPAADGMGSGNMAGGMTGAPSGSMVDVLRIRLEMAEAENTVESLCSEIAAAKARFNALLNRPVSAAVVLPDTLRRDGDVPDMETVVQRLAEQNPMLGMLREESLAWTAREEMTRRMGYPMFGIGLQYMLIGRTPAAAPAVPVNGGMNAAAAPSAMNGMNGKDMAMPMISLTLPLYRDKYRAAQRENRYRRQAVQAQYAETLNRLEADARQEKHFLDEAARKIILYRRQTQLVQSTHELLLREFAAGKVDLGAVIQVQRQLSDYRQKEVEAVAAFNTRAAAIRKMISTIQNQEQ
ncbi:MAG: TolC family protein [Tannerella sp.]|jgi:outer membrane protein TolC|nr:TolC family protein [Tannerella sp.]